MRAHYIPGEKFGGRVESEETTCLLDLHHKWVRAFKVCPVYGGPADISDSLDSPLHCQTDLSSVSAGLFDCVVKRVWVRNENMLLKKGVMISILCQKSIKVSFQFRLSKINGLSSPQ